MYLHSVVQQAADRDSCKIRTIDSYFENRRNNIGARPSFALLEFKLSIPDEVVDHPIIVELSNCSTDMIIIDNVCLQVITLKAFL